MSVISVECPASYEIYHNENNVTDATGDCEEWMQSSSHHIIGGVNYNNSIL